MFCEFGRKNTHVCLSLRSPCLTLIFICVRYYVPATILSLKALYYYYLFTWSRTAKLFGTGWLIIVLKVDMDYLPFVRKLLSFTVDCENSPLMGACHLLAWFINTVNAPNRFLRQLVIVRIFYKNHDLNERLPDWRLSISAEAEPRKYIHWGDSMKVHRCDHLLIYWDVCIRCLADRADSGRCGRSTKV